MSKLRKRKPIDRGVLVTPMCVIWNTLAEHSSYNSRLRDGGSIHAYLHDALQYELGGGLHRTAFTAMRAVGAGRMWAKTRPVD